MKTKTLAKVLRAYAAFAEDIRQDKHHPGFQPWHLTELRKLLRKAAKRLQGVSRA